MQGNVSTASLLETIPTHFITLEEKLIIYFSSTAICCCGWVRNPYSLEVEFHNTLDFAGARNIDSTWTRPWIKVTIF